MKHLEWFVTNPEDLPIIGSPEPSFANVPSWYKSLTRFFTKDNDPTETISVESRDLPGPGSTRSSIKTCVPFLDSLTSGYVVKLWCDVNVRHDEEGPVLEWTSVIPPINVRQIGSVVNTPVIPGFLPMRTVWDCLWGFKVPLGYSLLITHPFNRSDLPFVTATGIVDADSFYSPGSIPFSLNSSFEGVIKQGTPIAQIIPIKRESWKLSHNQLLKKEGTMISLKIRNYLYGGYRLLSWHKKVYK